MEPRNRHVSFIIPTLNEYESIEELHGRILDVCEQNRIHAQIVFVDDGSTDSTWEIMHQLVRGHEGKRPDGYASSASAAPLHLDERS